MLNRFGRFPAALGQRSGSNGDLRDFAARQSTIMPQIKLNFITGNKHKLAETQAILGSAIEVSSQTVDVPEIQRTTEEIAKEKARRASAALSNRPMDTHQKKMAYKSSRSKPLLLLKIRRSNFTRLIDFPGPTCKNMSRLCPFGHKPIQISKEFFNALGNEGLNRMPDGFNDRTA